MLHTILQIVTIKREIRGIKNPHNLVKMRVKVVTPRGFEPLLQP